MLANLPHHHSLFCDTTSNHVVISTCTGHSDGTDTSFYFCKERRVYTHSCQGLILILSSLVHSLISAHLCGLPQCSIDSCSSFSLLNSYRNPPMLARVRKCRLRSLLVSAPSPVALLASLPSCQPPSCPSPKWMSLSLTPLPLPRRKEVGPLNLLLSHSQLTLVSLPRRSPAKVSPLDPCFLRSTLISGSLLAPQ